MISDILDANNLKLNIDKTDLLRVASRQQHSGNKGEKIKLKDTDKKVIELYLQRTQKY